MKLRLEVKLPRFGTTMEEATVRRWLKSVGDEIAKGEAICEIETEKVALEFESPVAGRLAEILAAAGTNAEVGTVLCWIEADAVAEMGGPVGP